MTLVKAKKRIRDLIEDLETSDSIGRDKSEDNRDAKALRIALMYLEAIATARGALSDILNMLKQDQQANDDSA